MIYGKVYIYYKKNYARFPARFYEQGGFYRPFLITRLCDEGFQRFLDAFNPEKPLYGLMVNTTLLKYGSLDFMEQELENHDQVILIPTGLNSSALPVVYEQAFDVDTCIRKGVNVEKALLFSRDNKGGSIDHALIANPLDIIKRKSLQVRRTDIAGTADIVSALWKNRNTIHLISISAYKKEQGILSLQEVKA